MPRLTRWALALALACPAVALAQKPEIKPESVSFDSADGVELQGTFYPSAKGPATSPTVILLHSPFVSPKEGDWEGLAIMLAEKGYSTLRFDFRGQGKSTIVDPKKFWNANEYGKWNLKYLPQLAQKRPLPATLKAVDIEKKGATTYYFPMFANDILAARVYLDKRSDKGLANTSSLYLIGATDAATAGLIYLAAEWHRPKIVPPAGVVATVPTAIGNQDPAGADIAGAIWLSASVNPSMSPEFMQALLTGKNPGGVAATDMREKNPMLFLYGDQDAKATSTTVKNNSHFLWKNVLQAVPPLELKNTLQPLKFTKMEAIKNSKAVGVKLLGSDLGTEGKIVEFIEKIEKDRKAKLVNNRNYDKAPMLYAEAFGAFAR